MDIDKVTLSPTVLQQEQMETREVGRERERLG
jgi:hypothetical protein